MTAELTRRTFFTHLGRLVVILPVGVTLLAGAGCTDNANHDCDTADSVAATASAITVTSSCNGGHDHDFTVQNADLATPPAAGVTGESTPYDDDQHTHTVTLTSTQLTMINSGTSVPITSGTTLDHTHVFTFKKA